MDFCHPGMALCNLILRRFRCCSMAPVRSRGSGGVPERAEWGSLLMSCPPQGDRRFKSSPPPRLNAQPRTIE